MKGKLEHDFLYRVAQTPLIAQIARSAYRKGFWIGFTAGCTLGCGALLTIALFAL